MLCKFVWYTHNNLLYLNFLPPNNIFLPPYYTKNNVDSVWSGCHLGIMKLEQKNCIHFIIEWFSRLHGKAIETLHWAMRVYPILSWCLFVNEVIWQFLVNDYNEAKNYFIIITTPNRVCFFYLAQLQKNAEW